MSFNHYHNFNIYFYPNLFDNTLDIDKLTYDFDKPYYNKTKIFEKTFNQPINKYNLDSNIECLDLGNSFNQSIDDLPSKLKYLILGKKFSYPIDNLPSELKYLVINSNSVFNQPQIVYLINLSIIYHLN